MCIDKEKYRMAYLTLNSSEQAINEIFNLINSDVSELKEGKTYYFSGERKRKYNDMFKKLNGNRKQK